MENTQADIITYLRLHAIPAFGLRKLTKCAEHFRVALRQLSGVDNEQLMQVGWSHQQIAALKGNCRATEQKVRSALRWLKEHSLRAILHYDMTEYPASLREIASPPIVIFCDGNVQLLQHRKLAVVGSRAPTQYAADVLNELLPPLHATTIVTVSGLALGVDALCHRVSLAHGIPTIAVLGCGIDQVYPARNRQLFQSVKDQGLLISEFWPGTGPNSFQFPQRNRLISGLSDAVLITEGRIKSGTMVSVKFAIEQNKEVIAVPCSIFNKNSELSSMLIRDGAVPVVNTQDIIDAVPVFANDCTLVEKFQKNANQYLASDPLLDSVGDSATSVELIAKRTGMPVTDVLIQLLEYELRGLIACTAEGYVKLRG